MKIQLDVKLEIIKGRIAKCDVTVDGLTNIELIMSLTGIRYGYHEILQKLEAARFNEAAQIKIEKLMNCFL